MARQNDATKCIALTFAAWHRLDEPTMKRKLTILRPFPPEANYWDDFPKHSVQRIRVLCFAATKLARSLRVTSGDSPDQDCKRLLPNYKNP